MSQNPWAISLKGVTKNYNNGVAALKNVPLNIARGEFCFLVGPSGAGKSSLLALLLGEMRPTSGIVEVLGQRVDRLSRRGSARLRQNLGVVFQDFKLLNERTVAENVAFPLHIRGESKKIITSRVREALEVVGLAPRARHYPNQLSGGEQQRAAIARAIVTSPALLLADEPTGDLDPKTSLEVLKLFDTINRFGTTILLATHNDALLQAAPRRVIGIVAGSKVVDEKRTSYPHGVFEQHSGRRRNDA